MYFGRKDKLQNENAENIISVTSRQNSDEITTIRENSSQCSIHSVCIFHSQNLRIINNLRKRKEKTETIEVRTKIPATYNTQVG